LQKKNKTLSQEVNDKSRQKAALETIHPSAENGNLADPKSEIDELKAKCSEEGELQKRLDV
jgi:hypothetical protein